MASCKQCEMLKKGLFIGLPTSVKNKPIELIKTRFYSCLKTEKLGKMSKVELLAMNKIVWNYHSVSTAIKNIT